MDRKLQKIYIYAENEGKAPHRANNRDREGRPGTKTKREASGDAMHGTVNLRAKREAAKNKTFRAGITRARATTAYNVCYIADHGCRPFGCDCRGELMTRVK